MLHVAARPGADVGESDQMWAISGADSCACCTSSRGVQRRKSGSSFRRRTSLMASVSMRRRRCRTEHSGSPHHPSCAPQTFRPTDRVAVNTCKRCRAALLRGIAKCRECLLLASLCSRSSAPRARPSPSSVSSDGSSDEGSCSASPAQSLLSLSFESSPELPKVSL